jgi:cytochrome c-type biogenesis protein CcmF
MMLAEFGVFFLILALCCSVMQAAYLWPSRHRECFAACLPAASWLQALFIAVAFFTLMLLRIDSDFSVVTVAQHSNLSLPLLYKIAGTWGNHEGSMLLWLLILSGFGLALHCHSERSEESLQHSKDKIIRCAQDDIKKYATAVQAALAAGVLLFVLLTSNPFVRQFPPPSDGEALNPVLQDIALAIHPPLLYVGYVGFSIVFSLAVAALLSGKTGREFARIVRPWVLISWTALTLGIGLGSWWAYRELGWGGFWFWDPVENASLMPWLAGTALLHSTIVLEKRGQLASWVILLSILTFGLSLLGTFLVRSGALTSVHSFASDPARGLFILFYIVTAVGGALFVYSRRVRRIEPTEPMEPQSREGMIVFNNLFFLCACAVVLLGTVYPLFAEWINGEKLTVGAPYFSTTFVPLMALPLLFAGLAPMMPWKLASLSQAFRKLRSAVMAAAVVVFLILSWTHTHIVYAALGMGLGIWLWVASLQWLTTHWKNLPRTYALSVFCAHAGAALLVLGITGTGIWQQEINAAAAPGDTFDIAGYRLIYVKESGQRGENYNVKRAEIRIEHKIISIFPEYRTYDIRHTATSEAAIYSTWSGDLYAAIGEGDGKRTALRVYYNPGIRFVWLGCLMMGLAGALALAHTRRRVA